MSYAMIPDDSINYEEGAILCDFDDIIILVPDHYGQYMLQELVCRHTIKGVSEEALSIAGGGNALYRLRQEGSCLTCWAPGGPSFSVRPLEACTSSCPTCAVGGRSKSASYPVWKQGRSRTPSPKPLA